MPTVPKQGKCSELGCQNQKSNLNRFCLEHGGKDVQASGENKQWSHPFYTTPFWKVTRQRYLSTQPLCAGCYSHGRITQATVVDHVFPWTQLGEAAFYDNLFQSLCRDCHTHKTTLEKRGTFRWWHKDGVIDLCVGDYDSRVRH